LKRIVLFAWLGLAALTATPAFAAEQSGGEDRTIVWKWANCAILVGALGYAISKKAGAFFEARNAEVAQAIAAARKVKEEADAQLAEIDHRLALLDREILALRESARLEAEAEANRMRQETERELAKIQAYAEREIDAAVKLARLQLKTYAGDLAIDLAYRKIAERLSPEAQNGLVDLFVTGLNEEEARRPGGAAVV